jgi:hypothetical protein
MNVMSSFRTKRSASSPLACRKAISILGGLHEPASFVSQAPARGPELHAVFDWLLEVRSVNAARQLPVGCLPGNVIAPVL